MCTSVCIIRDETKRNLDMAASSSGQPVRAAGCPTNDGHGAIIPGAWFCVPFEKALELADGFAAAAQDVMMDSGEVVFAGADARGRR